MPTLTPWLQDRFEAHCPAGWRCRREAPLVDEAASRRLGFRPRADVLLEHGSSGRRVWVEFEVSRADPVANHAKFATSRFFEDLPPGDSFVSMTSRHIEPGRAALAAGTAAMMRALGIPAFQVMLLPQFDGPAVKHLNSLPRPRLDEMALPVGEEVARVLEVTDASTLSDGHCIHKADNPWTVSMNVRRWNLEMAQPDRAALWGRRPVQYFAFDPATSQFAPSKFCAFIPGANLRAHATGRVLASDAGARGHAVSLGLARCSCGSARAWVALARQAASSCGYTPCSRHQALRVASSMAAVVSTASNRAAADHARSRAGVVSACARHRSSVSTDTPISRETSSMEAVLGGSSLATTLPLKAVPYRAIASSHHRPHCCGSMEATTILTRGAPLQGQH